MFSRSLTCQNSHVDISPLGRLDWLISMQCSHKAFHFLSVSDGARSILSDIVISLQKSHEIIFVTYFWKNKNTCERCFWDVSEICPRRPKDVTKKTSFLKCIWDVTKKTSLLRCFWDVSEISLSMEIWLRSLRDISCWLGITQNIKRQFMEFMNFEPIFKQLLRCTFN